MYSDYTVKFNNRTSKYEMRLRVQLEGGHSIEAETVILTATDLQSAVAEAERFDALYNAPEIEYPSDAELNEMAEYYGYGKESYGIEY